MISKHLTQEGLTLKEGAIVDATIISAPSSTKNKAGQRDEEMSSTRKGNQPYFGMKMHIGTDDSVGCIYSIDTTPANEHDITAAEQLLHGEENVFGVMRVTWVLINVMNIRIDKSSGLSPAVQASLNRSQKQ